MLATHDLELLSRMVKNQLEELIIRRASDSTAAQDNNYLGEEIDKLYALLSKLIILVEQNIEIGIINMDPVDQIHSTKLLRNTSKTVEVPNDFANNILSAKDLAYRLVGTCWRKNNRAEVIIFREPPEFDYLDILRAEWSSHEYFLGDRMGGMELHWKVDNFKATCEFADGFTTFVEVYNPDLIWTLEWAP